MTQKEGQNSLKLSLTSPGRYFSYGSDESHGYPSPWRAAFPATGRLGYWEAFGRRCARIFPNPDGLIEEDRAREVWLSLLRDYEDYQRMGMWIPEDILVQHRRVAEALGWSQ